MGKLIINNFDELKQYEGNELGISKYHQFTQEQINLLADATIDHQWIHVDTERAKKESPFGTTIVHGYLTLSIVPHLWDDLIEVNNIKMLVNYGIENLRFQEPVMVNDEVRLKAELQSIKNLRGISKTEVKITLEIKGKKKPAFVGTVVFLYHFK